MTIRKRDLFWGFTGAMLTAAVVLLGLGQPVGIIVAVAALVLGWAASGTSISSGTTPVWLMPPTTFPEPEEPVAKIDDGFVPFYEQPEEAIS